MRAISHISLRPVSFSGSDSCEMVSFYPMRIGIRESFVERILFSIEMEIITCGGIINYVFFYSGREMRRLKKEYTSERYVLFFNKRQRLNVIVLGFLMGRLTEGIQLFFARN